VAKYSSTGQYQFAFKFGGFGLDVGRGIDLDNAGNIYVTGDFNGSSIDFDPSAGTALLSSNGASDIFVGKYTNSGQYVWAFNAGSSGGEISWTLQQIITVYMLVAVFQGWLILILLRLPII
jgi:DNA-binding beta-propeller fold protein YncE